MADLQQQDAVVRSRAVQGVIFDLGGTLVYQNADPEPDRERRQCEAIARLAARELRCRDPEALAERLVALRNEHGGAVLRDLVERRARETIACGLREAGLSAGDDFLERAERVLFAPDRGRPLYPGARDLLERLRGAGLHVGLISNWSSHWIVTEIVAEAGIVELLSPVVSSAAFGRIKPHPSIFRHVLATWGIGPHDAVMIGDTLETDILGASQIGMPSVLVDIESNPANAAFEATIRPTFRVENLLDIAALLAL
jgi:HAD superfamily hydrolase (TIGR01549 family)